MKADQFTKSPEHKDYRVLFVCLGNICRSPTAEGVLKHLLAAEAPHIEIEIDSAGIGNYHIGEPPDVRSQRAAMQRGIDLSALRARQVAAEDFAHFDLIIAMDRANLRALEAMKPAASKAQLKLFLEYANHRGQLDVPDPYCGNADDFEQVLDLVIAAARGLIRSLS